MNFIYRNILIGILLFTFSSQLNARVMENDTVFHNERNINFKIYESGSSIVVQFYSEKTQLVKLLEQLGLKIYFNEEMKKRDDIYINYPKGTRTEIGLDEDEQKELQAKRKNEEIDYNLTLKNIKDDAEYGYNGKERIFNILLNSLEVKGEISLDDEEVLHYKLEVPKKLINPDNPDQVDAFMLGIESGSVPVKQRQRTANASRRMRQGRMGRGRRGRMGMQRRGLQQANTRTVTINRSPLEIWFDVKL
jgi:hypothetical protein